MQQPTHADDMQTKLTTDHNDQSPASLPVSRPTGKNSYDCGAVTVVTRRDIRIRCREGNYEREKWGWVFLRQ